MLFIKTDYPPFVVDEISSDVVTSVVFIVSVVVTCVVFIVSVVVAVSSVSLVKTIVIGTTMAVMITIPAMIPKKIHIFVLRIIVPLKNESVLCYLLN